MRRVFFRKFYDFYTINDYFNLADRSQKANLILGFDDFNLLDEVGPIDKLIITGGDASTAHYDALYRHNELEGLILDYHSLRYQSLGLLQLQLKHLMQQVWFMLSKMDLLT